MASKGSVLERVLGEWIAWRPLDVFGRYSVFAKSQVT
jgi:hypothetical protein